MNTKLWTIFSSYISHFHVMMIAFKFPCLVIPLAESFTPCYCPKLKTLISSFTFQCILASTVQHNRWSYFSNGISSEIPLWFSCYYRSILCPIIQYHFYMWDWCSSLTYITHILLCTSREFKLEKCRNIDFIATLFSHNRVVVAT